MDYQNQRTAYGKFMFNTLLKGSLFLMRHPWLYYVLNYTWGILTTFCGWVAYFFMKLILGKKIKDCGKFGPCRYLMFGNNWGGLEMGTNFFVADNMGESWTLHTKQHETGHTFQNAILGPFAIILVFIPSAIRYWYQRLSKKTQKPYDAIWFEGEASAAGLEFYTNYLGGEK